jgi:hypothetical protein
LRGLPDLPRGVRVQKRDAEPDDQVRPSRDGQRRQKASRDDGDVGEGVVACREKGCLRQAAAVIAKPRQHQRAGEVDGERAEAGEGQRHRIGRDRRHELAPGRPQRREAGHQQHEGERQAEPRPPRRAPTEPDENQQVDRGVLEKIHRVGE